MIEREFISQKTKEYYIKKYIEEKMKGAGISQITLKKIPLGEKIIISTARPSLIIGSKGSNIKSLTKTLKSDFNLENPQIEINEVNEIFLDASVVAERIASSLEKFGSARFKSIGHKIMENVLNSGALGIELIISGKIPGARARSWRFYQGYLKKCGDVAIAGVRKAQKYALLKSGIIGIKVAIMPPNLVLPDHIKILDQPIQAVEEITERESDPKNNVARKKSSSKKTYSKKKAKEEKKELSGEHAYPQTAHEEVAEEPAEPSKESTTENAVDLILEEIKEESADVAGKAIEDVVGLLPPREEEKDQK